MFYNMLVALIAGFTQNFCFYPSNMKNIRYRNPVFCVDKAFYYLHNATKQIVKKK